MEIGIYVMDNNGVTGKVVDIDTSIDNSIGVLFSDDDGVWWMKKEELQVMD